MRERGAALLRHPEAPLWALGLVLVLSLISRTIDIGSPPHTLIFDEAFYVNAARIIDHIHATSHYAGAPFGLDPNAEHPQLAKLIIAAGIKLFGDNPWGWRIGSVVFGTIALLGMYAVAIGLGTSRWLAVGVTAVMASDNLFLVHGRIATLDIYALAMMLLAAAAYVRGRPLLTGVLIGIAGAMKETALFILAVLVIFELLLAIRRAGARWIRLVIACVTGVVSFVAILAILDQIVTPWNPLTHQRYTNPFSQIAHIFTYGRGLTQIAHATGISSSPWQWMVDQKPIPYAEVTQSVESGGKVIASHILILFSGQVNPFIMFIAIPALIVALVGAWRGDRADAFAVAWFLGTFLPYVYICDVGHRITYLYYILEAMPAIYLAGARLFARAGPVAILGWSVALLAGIVDLYPIRTLF